MKKMEHAVMKLSDLIPASYNPRWMSKAALQGLDNSIRAFGLVQPIVWNKQTRNIVGGHQRVNVLRSQGETEAEVIIVDLAENDELALNIVLNSEYVRGTWDDSKIASVLQDIEDRAPEFFKAMRIVDLKEQLGVQEVFHSSSKDDEVPPFAKPVCRKGDLWKMGRHTLFCGMPDCKSIPSIVKSESIACVLIDGFQDFDFLRFVPLSDQNTIFAFCGTELARVGSELSDLAIVAGTPIVWIRETPMDVGTDYLMGHEMIFRGWKTGQKYDGSKEVAVMKQDDLRAACERPVELFCRLMANGCVRTSNVLIPFAGNGSALIAAEKTNRRAMLTEKDPEKCDMILQRFVNFCGDEDVLNDKGKKWSDL